MEKITMVAVILLIFGFFAAMIGMFTFNIPVMSIGVMLCALGFIVWVVGELKGRSKVYTG